MKQADSLQVFSKRHGEKVHPLPDDQFWRTIEHTHREEITAFISTVLGSSDTDINRAWGAAIARINNLIAKKKIDLMSESFLPFLKQAVLDEAIVYGLKNGDDALAVQFLEQMMLPAAIKKLCNGSPLNQTSEQEIISEALNVLEQRAKAGHLPSQGAHLHEAVLDEALIAALRCAEPVCSIACSFIRNNWFNYILKPVDKKDMQEDLFNLIIGNFSRRINHPQKGEKLVLEHALKTYLYRCVVLEFSHVNKKMKNETSFTAQQSVPVDTTLYTDDSPQPENYKVRWHGNNLSPTEMYKVIREIPAECKSIFLLVYEEYNNKEIGEKLNIATGTVNNRRSKCYDIIDNLILKIKNNNEK